MAMKYEGERVAAEFKAAFGIDIEDVTPAQAMVIAKMIKHGRVRCRSNAALYNCMGRWFSGLKFKDEETKNPPGHKYATRKSMKITPRANFVVPVPNLSILKPDAVSDDDDDGDE